ncbi:TetR/AcrR family transcriptional regulator [Bacillus salacetis]|uniref:TetR/AcrR family transcriptional regulator n=1 Tax=Bacillus salacetis TaxID=2315464 RepID=A0A3A1R0V8_9BACI|nr:TetR/AcrR family transcriptional regulator [Bacillus salacetis]RIW35142.1 TetR/AcrR family transcriptional regulator [Bacillus salacetis]
MSPKVSREHKQQRRAKLIGAAAEVFMEHGYENTTMKHVMEKAGVSRGGLYQYFDNKEDLFHAVIESQQEKIIDHSLENLLKQQDTYWDALLMTFLGEGKQPDDNMDPLSPSKLEYFITGRNEKDRREYAKRRYQHAIEVTFRLLEEGEKSGEFSPRFDKQVIAKSILSYIDGLALGHAVLDHSTIELKEQTALLVDFLRWALGLEEQ